MAFQDPISTFAIAFIRAGAVPNNVGQYPVEIYTDNTTNIAAQIVVLGTGGAFTGGTFSGVSVRSWLPFANGCVVNNTNNDSTTQIISGTPSASWTGGTPGLTGETLILSTSGMVLDTDNDNVAVVATVNRITGPSGDFVISGLAGGRDGMVVILKNETAHKMTLQNNDADSAAGNKFIFPNGDDITTNATDVAGSIALIYDQTLASGAGAWTTLNDSNIVYV